MARSDTSTEAVPTGRPPPVAAPLPSPPPTKSLRVWQISAYSAAVFAMFITTWQWITDHGVIHSIILPPPKAVGEALIQLVASPGFTTHVSTTLFETVVGFVIGVSSGFVFAFADVLSPLVRRAFRPYIIVLQAMPKIALVPLIVTWLGFGPSSKVAQAALLSFFPVFANTVVGLSVVEEFTVPLMRSLTATKWQIFRYLRLPSAMPAFFAGLRTSLTFALVGAIVSEMIASRRGLGMILVRYQAAFDIALMYAVIVVMALIGLVLFLFIAWVDRRVVFWRRDRSFF